MKLTPAQEVECQRAIAPVVRDMFWHSAQQQAARMKSKGKRRKFLEREAKRLGVGK